MAILIADSFTAADGTDIAGRTPDTTTGGATWSERSGNWQITGNAAALSALQNHGHATIDSGQANCTLTVEANSTETASTTETNSVLRSAGAVARWSDANNFWAIGVHAGNDAFRIVEINAGVRTVRASASVTIDAGTLYTVQAVLNGSTIDATLDGANAIQYASATLNQTATVHGILARGTNDRVDDFVVDDGAAAGINGSAAITLGDVTLVATGVVSLNGTLAVTLGDLTLSAAASLAIAGEADITLGELTLAATGESGIVSIEGAADITLGALTLAATAQLLIGGELAATLGELVAAATGSLGINADASIQLDALTLSGAGSIAIQGTANITLGALTLIATNEIDTVVIIAAIIYGPSNRGTVSSPRATGTIGG